MSIIKSLEISKLMENNIDKLTLCGKRNLVKVIIFHFSLFTFHCLHSQSSSQNYVKTTTYKKPTTQGSVNVNNPVDAVVSVSYFDGLGRPIQQIAHQQAANGNDIITHIEYDAFGRQTKEFLPYVINNTNISYRTGAATEVLTYYQTPYYENTSNPYSEKLLEASPLNRVLKQAAPGNPWALGSGNEIKFDYQTNVQNTDKVRVFKAQTTWNNTLQRYDISLVQNQGFYATGQLYKTITKDENWTSGLLNTTEEFKNKLGQVILKRTYINTPPSGEPEGADTYYIYDDYGNLTYVLPPLVQTVQNGNPTTITQSTLDELCYQYVYDYRNRLIEKKLPQKAWEYIVFDKLDRVLATGPVYSPFPEQASTQQGWMVTKYDAFNRPILTAWLPGTVNATERKNLQVARNNQTTNFSEQKNTSNTTVNGIAFRYTNVAWPTSNYHVLTTNYFDNYDYPNAPSVPTSILGQPILNGQSGNTKTLPTGTWVRVLQGQTQYNGNLTTTFYDTKGRVVATNTTNYLGGYTNTETKLDFAGQPQESITRQIRDVSNGDEIYIRELFTYTPQGRLLTHTHQVNNNPVEVLVHNTYDALGQLVTKQVGGDETYVQNIGHLQTVDYQYNIRGWLKQINDVEDLTTTNDLFAFKINYDTPEVYGTTPLYNGNISETIWKTSSDNIHRGYGYEYDKLNRLTNAYFGTNHQINNHFNEHLSYDKNGNILTLNRTGNVDGFEQVIDDLTYDYIGNQLLKVTEALIANAHFGFKDGTNTNEDYRYDDFGNMVRDLNKGITEINYNHLNLPIKITFANGNFITYIYDAIGVKVNKYVQGTSGSTSTGSYTDYLNGFQYNNNALQFFPHSEGYVKVLGNTNNPEEEVLFDYVYQYKDHLGNIRLNFTKDEESLKILEENHYYPFGLKHTYNYSKFEPILEEDEHSGLRSRRITQVPNSGYQYKYQGQERQDELGLNVDSYKYRNYDYAIGRFFNMDRFSEKYTPISPYSHVANNPLKYVEIQGDSIMLIIGKPYKLNGKDHPYGHVALRVYNSKEGYDYVYDFGRYGAVRGAFGQTGDGILNVYDNSEAYFKTEQSIRESIAYSEYSTVAEDKAIIAHFNKLIAAGTLQSKGKGKASYKLADDYDIFDNNCTTMSASGLGVIGENWLGGEYDPRDALKYMEANYKNLGLSRTVYKKGGGSVVTHDTSKLPKKPSERTIDPKEPGNKIGDAGPADKKRELEIPTGIKW